MKKVYMSPGSKCPSEKYKYYPFKDNLVHINT